MIPGSDEVDRETLQAWLEEGRPVEVIDIRPQADYDAWHIAGSHNVDAYKAIYARSPGPLADYEAPDDTPVVAVCFVGQTSKIAAHYLRSRGIPAQSLAGGMQEWSLAWNRADVPLPRSNAQVIQVRRTGKGCLSYLVGDRGEALVIDASLEPQIYLDIAAEKGWRITDVVDTHIHADHLSRGRVLAKAAGAAYLLPQQVRATFNYIHLAAGALVNAGRAQLRILGTPGHTFESTCLLLDDTALFSGDTLLVNSVGRPDLKADRVESEVRARALYQSLQTLRALPASALVLPGHSGRPVPFDHVPVAATLAEVIDNVPALGYDEETFVSWILERIPPDPPSYQLIVQFNEAGELPLIDLTQLEAGANNCAI